MPSLPRHLFPVVIAMIAVGCTTLVACSSSPAAPTSGAGATSGPWTFTDDLGKTVALDHAPTRIAGINDQIVPLLNYGLEPVASWGYSAIEDDARFDGLDTSGIEQLGSAYGEINLELLAAARPDVIVSEVFPTDANGTVDPSQPDFGFNSLAQQKKVEAIAPIITILIGGDGAEVVENTTHLAVALGADSATVAKTKADYDAAANALAQAAAANPVTVTALFADTDGINVAKAPDDPALHLYADLGVKFFAPEASGFYWSNYSWENASEVVGDLWLLEQSGYDIAELNAQPTMANNEALAADQVHPWVSAALDYASQANYMEQLAGWITDAKVVTG